MQDAVIAALKNPAVSSVVGKTATSIAGAIGAEVVTEMAQENVNIIGEEIAKTASNFVEANPTTWEDVKERNLDTAFETLKATFLALGGVGGTLTYRSNIKKARQSSQKALDIQNAIDAINGSSLAKENPNLLEEQIAKTIGNSKEREYNYLPAQEVYETLFQSDEGIALAKKLGIYEVDLADAIALDMPIAIKTEKALAHLYPSKFGAELKNLATYDPNDFSKAQIEQLQNEIGKENLAKLFELEEFTDINLQQAYVEESELGRLDSIAEPYIRALLNAGYTENQAVQQARVLASNAQIMSPIFNQTPEEYLSTRLEITSQESYNQSQIKNLPTKTDNPLWNTIYKEGIELDSLRAENPQAFKNIINTHGSSFLRSDKSKTKGLSLQELTQKFIDQGFFPQNATPQNLIDFLSTPTKFFQEEQGTNQNVVDLSNSFEKTPSIEDVRTYIKELFNNGLKYATLSPNWFVDIQGNSEKRNHIVYSSQYRNLNKREKARHNKYIMQIEKLINNAQYINSKENTKKEKKQNIEQYHYFNTDVKIGEKIYQIQLVAEEYVGDSKEKPQTVHLYDVLEIKNTPLSKRFQETSYPLNEVLSEENINTNKNDVNYQNTTKPRGMIQFNPNSEKALITIFEDRKNLSTTLHELSHFFLYNLQRAYMQENAPMWVKESFETLANELKFNPHMPLSESTQEKFARLGEAYFREGKAPRKELQSAFNQFKSWLQNIYKYITNILRAEDLNAEVKSVFDSLLATQEQIETAKTLYENSSLADNETVQNIFDMPKEKLSAYQNAVNKAKQKADAEIFLRKRHELNEIEKEARIAAKQYIEYSPFYTILNKIRNNGKIDFASLMGFLTEKAAFELRAKWNANGKYKHVFADSGKSKNLMSVDEAANYYNINAEELITLLTNELPEMQYITEVINSQKQKFEAEFDADAELISTEMENALVLEIEALGGQAIPQNFLKEKIEESTNLKKQESIDSDYKNLKADLRKQNKVIKEVLRNLNSKKQQDKNALKEQLIQLKKQEQIKRAKLRASYKAKIRKEQIIRNAKKIANSKTIPDNYKQQILQIIGKYKGLGTPRMQAKEGTPSLMAFFSAMNSEAEGNLLIPLPEVPEFLISDSNRSNANTIKDLSPQELEQINSLIESLAHIGRAENTLLGAQRKKQTLKTVLEMTLSMQGLSEKRVLSDKEKASRLGRSRTWGREVLSSMSLMRYTFDKADGYRSDDKGKNKENIITPIQESQSNEQELLTHFTQKFYDIWNPLQTKEYAREFAIDNVSMPAELKKKWGGKFSYDRVIAIVLNMGNEGNLKALMNGYGWSYENLITITSRLSKEQLEAVQKTWDLLEELKPYIAKTYKELNGTDMSEVKAQSLTFATATGEQVTLKGGYYPLMFDADLSNRAKTIQAMEDVENIINNNAFIPNTPKIKNGMTMERTGSNLPPLLSMSSVIGRHLTDSIKYATHAVAIKNVHTLIKHPVYRDEFVKHFGQEEYDQIIPWLKSIAQVDREPSKGFQATADYLTKRGSIYAMGLSLRTMVMQFNSITNSMNVVGVAPFVKGAFKMIASKERSYSEVKKLSHVMNARANTFDKTIANSIARFDPNKTALRIGNKVITRQQYESALFGFISVADAMIAFPTWIGKYDVEIARGTEQSRAVFLADEAVIKAQGSGLTMDTAKFMRDKGAMQFLTMFMSFATNWQNRQRYYLGGYKEFLKGNNSQINHKEFYKHIAIEWLMPVMLTLILQSLQEDEMPEPKDIGEEFASYFLMGVPLARDAVSVFAFGKDFGASAAGQGINLAVKGIKGTYKVITEDTKKEQEYNTMKNIINAIGFFARVPTNSFFRVGEGTSAWLEGEAGLGAIFLGKPYK